MASIAATPIPQDTIGVREVVKLWSPLTSTDDTGLPEVSSFYTDKEVQFTGTFGGATVVVEGTLVNSPGASDWFTLKGQDGLALSFTSAGGGLIVDHCIQIRVRITTGATGSTSINAYLLLASSARR